MAGVPIPENATDVSDKLIGYTSDWRGQRWVNVRKTYTDKGGDAWVGKGLMLSIDDWNELVANFENLKEFIDEELNG